MIWNRKDLKAKGKAAFLANYWKCVLAAILIALLVCVAAVLGGKNLSVNLNVTLNDPEFQSEVNDININEFLESLDVGAEGEQSIDQLPPQIQQAIQASGADSEDMIRGLTLILAILAAILPIIILISSLFKILLLNPLAVGIKNFFFRNSEAPASLNEIGAGFRSWGRNVKAMFLRDLFLFLWSLLFGIPGIVKSYSYRLVPYLLADNPELHGAEAITLSRQLMNGHKWDTFVLDLSFLGWNILSSLSFGILGILYVNPYIVATEAELYRALRSGASEDAMWA